MTIPLDDVIVAAKITLITYILGGGAAARPRRGIFSSLCFYYVAKIRKSSRNSLCNVTAPDRSTTMNLTGVDAAQSIAILESDCAIVTTESATWTVSRNFVVIVSDPDFPSKNMWRYK